MTYQMNYIKNLFNFMARNEKLELLENSNLTDREVELLTKRFVKGESLKECALCFNLEEDTINKNQLKAVKKLYSFLNKD